MLHIVILIHPTDPFERERYVIREIADVWREGGIGVTVSADPAAAVDADLAILHVDLTIIPPPYVALCQRYRKVLNGTVVDISKRRVSRQLVRRGDGWDGPVIVKTDCNSGGAREHALAGREPMRRRWVRSLRDRLPWCWRPRLPTGNYRVFDSPRHVPRIVWYNPDLVVERFLPERSGGQYCLRTWVFLGDRETNSLSYADEPIIKGYNVVRREVVDEVPDELRQMRRAMGFDFGKFDYGIVDGRVVLYDVNRTPSLGGMRREQFEPRARLLAEGIRAFA